MTEKKELLRVSDDTEVAWHREQIAKNRAILDELEAGNTEGRDVFPRPNLRSSISKRRLLNPSSIVAASEKLQD